MSIFECFFGRAARLFLNLLRTQTKEGGTTFASTLGQTVQGVLLSADTEGGEGRLRLSTGTYTLTEGKASNGMLNGMKGTLIVEATCQKPRFIITGIAGKKDFAAVTVEKAMMNSEVGFCRKVLQVFEENGISIEHMPSGIDTMSVFVHQDELKEMEQKVIAGIHREVEPDVLELESDLALVAVVGRGMRTTRGTSGRIFSALAHANIEVKMIDQGSSGLNVIIGVPNDDFEAAVKAIYDIFVTTQL